MRRRLRVMLLLLCTLGAGCVASDAAGGLFRAAGIAVRYPTGWFVSTEPLNGIVDPVQRFVLSSYRITRTRPHAEDGYGPPPRGGIVAQLVEEVPPLDNGGSWPSRPRRFRLTRPGPLEGFAGDRWVELRFRDRGRRFYVFIGIGRRAPAARLKTLLRTLDAISISAR